MRNGFINAVIILIVITALVVTGVFILRLRKESETIQINTSSHVTKDTGNFFLFSIPKPLENLTIYDLPNNNSSENVIEYNDHLWFTGTGSLVEYDTKSGKLVSYSDPKKANCDRNLVLINGYIFVPCRIDNIEVFGQTNPSKIFMGQYAIFKIDPLTHKVNHIFSKTDGLLNGYNYHLVADGDFVWIETFNGIGRINTKTNQLDFYTKELGFQHSSNAISYSVRPIIVDKDYVWAWHNSSAESQGGIALFNKQSGTWTAFGPKELKDYSFNGIDLEFENNSWAAKLIPGGIQIAFRDGNLGTENRLVEKQYIYQTGNWIKIGSERIATGAQSEQTRQYISSTYPQVFNFQRVDEFDLTQLQIPDTNEVYQIDGRNNYILSPVIDNKRYVLTNATIDLIDDTSPYSQILIKLGESLEAGGVHYPSSESEVGFFIDPDSLIALVINPDCGGYGCTDNQKAWLVNLKSPKIYKVYTKTDGLPDGNLLLDLSMIKQGDRLIIKGKTGDPVFSINITNYELTTFSK